MSQGARTHSTHRRMVAVLGAAAVLLTAACSSDRKAAAPTASPTTVPVSAEARVQVKRAVQYGTSGVGGPTATKPFALLMDLYLPTAATTADPAPVVIAIHGGGFTSQSRTDPGIVRIAQGLAAEGIAVAAIDYRLDGQQPVPSARVAPFTAAMGTAPLSTAMAAAVDDTLTAIDHLQANEEGYPIEADRLGLVGSSAGAITADHVGYTLDDHGIDPPLLRFVASLWGGLFVPPPTGMADPSANQLEANAPALFAVHGDADTTVPVILDDQLVDRAKAVGVPTEYHRLLGGSHGFEGSGFFTVPVDGAATSFDRLLAFAKEALRR